jgi:hypothetical protein
LSQGAKSPKEIDVKRWIVTPAYVGVEESWYRISGGVEPGNKSVHIGLITLEGKQ